MFLFQTMSCAWNVVASGNHRRVIAHIYVLSSSTGRQRHELHSLLYKCIEETVTINNSGTAEVQGEATARREHCGYIARNQFHIGSSTLKGTANTSPQTHHHRYKVDMQAIICEMHLEMTHFFKVRPENEIMYLIQQ